MASRLLVASIDILLLLLLSLYDAFTLPIYLLLFKPWEKRKLVQRAKVRVIERGSGHVVVEPSRYLRPCLVRESMLSESSDIVSIDDLLTFCAKRFGNRRCLGFRPIIREEMVENNQLKRIAEDKYVWKSYNEVVDNALCLARALRQLLALQQGEKVALLADTRMEWMISALGIFRADLVLVTLNSHLDVASQLFGLKESNVGVLITSKETLSTLTSHSLTQETSIRKVVLLPSIVVGESIVSTDTSAEQMGLECLMYYEKLIEEGGKLADFDRVRCGDQDALLMYTSGTTGSPKAVVLTHTNLVTSVQDCTACFASIMDEQDVLEKDNFYSYAAFLPLSHIFELQQELLMLMMGIPIGYSSPYTLTDTGTMVAKGEKGDAVLLRPTNMSTVPLILDRIYKRINAKLDSKGAIVSRLFKRLINYKIFWQNQHMDCPLLNVLIFDKFKAILGNNMQVVVVGGAPLNAQVQSFIRATLGTHTVSGYGLTETAGGVLLPDHFDYRQDIVGFPLPRTKLRLESWSEGGYETKNMEGELQFAGPSILDRYYGRSDLTLESCFDDEHGQRWFRTGDIGRITEDGVVVIIDRKKELAKLQTGLYVSCGKIEAVLRTHPLVEQVCVVARSTHSFVSALVVIDATALRQLAKLTELENECSVDDIHQLCKDKSMTEQVSKLLIEHCFESGLLKAEIPRRMLLIAQPWTMDQGLVTASLKIKRKPIEQHYINWIEQVYS